jgi:uncharacterized protein YggE
VDTGPDLATVIAASRAFVGRLYDEAIAAGEDLESIDAVAFATSRADAIAEEAAKIGISATSLRVRVIAKLAVSWPGRPEV